MNLTMPFDFIHVTINKRKHSTKDEYFPKHTLFSTIYLLQEEKFNHRNYPEQEINMINFVK
jgi:hypothetical protein